MPTGAFKENLGTDAVPCRRVTDEALQCGGGAKPGKGGRRALRRFGTGLFHCATRSIDTQTFGILASHPVLLVADHAVLLAQVVLPRRWVGASHRSFNGPGLLGERIACNGLWLGLYGRGSSGVLRPRARRARARLEILLLLPAHAFTFADSRDRPDGSAGNRRITCWAVQILRVQHSAGALAFRKGMGCAQRSADHGQGRQADRYSTHA
ncbi:hypothetical protein DFLDMN_006459 (plasmid) [Cupriavidus sp. H19C3]